MKKLLIAAIGVAVATVASAASINWSVAGNTFAKSGSDTSGNLRAKNYLVYAFAASDYSSVLAALNNGTVTKAQAVDNALAYAKGGEAGVGRTTATGAAGGTLADVTTEATYSLFLVAFDTFGGGAADTAVNYLASAQLSGATYAEMSPSTSIDYTSSNWGNAAWTEIAPEQVPEPTSGMLLLIGMAGLALKRKRA